MKNTHLLSWISIILLSMSLYACQKNTSDTEQTEDSHTIEAKYSAAAATDEFQVKRIKGSTLTNSQSIPSSLVYWDESEEEEEGSLIEYTDLYPLGWSKDGQFAWLEYAITYHGGHALSYYIQDMKTNQKLWEYETILDISEDEEYNEEVSPDMVIQVEDIEAVENTFELLWSANEQKVLAALADHKIIYQPSTKLIKQDTYKGITFELESKEGTDEENPFECLLTNNQGESVLLNKHYQAAHYTRIAGILENPHGTTFAVVCEQKRQFFEMSDEVIPLVAGFE